MVTDGAGLGPMIRRLLGKPGIKDISIPPFIVMKIRILFSYAVEFVKCASGGKIEW